MLKKETGNGRKVAVFLLIALYFTVCYAVMNYYKISCVFLEFLGIPCPGCGMTRALASLLKLDFYGAAKYNITIFFMPYVLVYLMFPLKHKIHNIFLLAIAVIAIINWIIKLIILF